MLPLLNNDSKIVMMDDGQIWKDKLVEVGAGWGPSQQLELWSKLQKGEERGSNNHQYWRIALEIG